MYLPVALGEIGAVDVCLVNPDGVALHDSVLVAGCRGELWCRPPEGHLVGDAVSSVARSTGTLWLMSLMKETRRGLACGGA